MHTKQEPELFSDKDRVGRYAIQGYNLSYCSHSLAGSNLPGSPVSRFTNYSPPSALVKK